ncbi:hypothetical protein C1645_821244 [Glomus cerebriforme]|uniref:HAT C-terminal dimerisation domain-containing protein n=1 Tax=Glomus cerebriforme TaxID=658196 RepID=A0A397T0K8_9GLOM|nr:hypothetical protein C1645_821244 [Glomus cerebriforme]
MSRNSGGNKECQCICKACVEVLKDETKPILNRKERVHKHLANYEYFWTKYGKEAEDILGNCDQLPSPILNQAIDNIENIHKKKLNQVHEQAETLVWKIIDISRQREHAIDVIPHVEEILIRTKQALRNLVTRYEIPDEVSSSTTKLYLLANICMISYLEKCWKDWEQLLLLLALVLHPKYHLNKFNPDLKTFNFVTIGIWLKYYYKELGFVTTKIFSICVNSVSVERLFSSMGFLHTSRRNKLKKRKRESENLKVNNALPIGEEIINLELQNNIESKNT